ncbi:hypothetical protein CONPUDRAFT_54556 [Coniophora puteana RWD-64-598 SS2]|uniref:N-acetyltransferase domain-containing protein n=1 Tax=Coniophora puteana (strain RWD-64-598) TaxID=741705 RepID=A0A5M3MT64_CONPW|nr:uncharacterized protein CONPUDRAFT_54556 [Coniophora puteana RWD-64-598 SS2]EIW82280.1 hypothetical protein CONPUDRAFT_54556 [Coniophora puteana RWD-64-598 SS2]
MGDRGTQPGLTSKVPDRPPHELVVAPAGHPRRSEIQKQCIDVRIAVFIHEQGFSIDDEVDKYDSDPRATHILLRLVPSMTPIGTIRAVKLAPGKYKLSRLAVLKEYRQYRFGRDLVHALHAWVEQSASQDGVQSAQIIAHSQIPVKPFYAKYGYVNEGPEFEEDGAPHQKMVFQLQLSR